MSMFSSLFGSTKQPVFNSTKVPKTANVAQAQMDYVVLEALDPSLPLTLQLLNTNESRILRMKRMFDRLATSLDKVFMSYVESRDVVNQMYDVHVERRAEHEKIIEHRQQLINTSDELRTQRNLLAASLDGWSARCIHIKEVQLGRLAALQEDLDIAKRDLDKTRAAVEKHSLKSFRQGINSQIDNSNILAEKEQTVRSLDLEQKTLIKQMKSETEMLLASSRDINPRLAEMLRAATVNMLAMGLEFECLTGPVICELNDLARQPAPHVTPSTYAPVISTTQGVTTALPPLPIPPPGAAPIIVAGTYEEEIAKGTAFTAKEVAASAAEQLGAPMQGAGTGMPVMSTSGPTMGTLTGASMPVTATLEMSGQQRPLAGPATPASTVPSEPVSLGGTMFTSKSDPSLLKSEAWAQMGDLKSTRSTMDVEEARATIAAAAGQPSIESKISVIPGSGSYFDVPSAAEVTPIQRQPLA